MLKYPIITLAVCLALTGGAIALADTTAWPVKQETTQDNFTNAVTKIVSASKKYPMQHGGEVLFTASCKNDNAIDFEFTLLDVLGITNAVSSFAGNGIEYRLDDGPVQVNLFGLFISALTQEEANKAHMIISAVESTEDNQAGPTLGELLRTKIFRLRLHLADGGNVDIVLPLAELHDFFEACPISRNAMRSVKAQAIAEAEDEAEIHQEPAGDQPHDAYPQQLVSIIDPSDWPYVRSAIIAAKGMGQVQKMGWTNEKNGHNGIVLLTDTRPDPEGCYQLRVVRITEKHHSDYEPKMTAHVDICADGSIK